VLIDLLTTTIPRGMRGPLCPWPEHLRDGSGPPMPAGGPAGTARTPTEELAPGRRPGSGQTSACVRRTNASLQRTRARDAYPGSAQRTEKIRPLRSPPCRYATRGRGLHATRLDWPRPRGRLCLRCTPRPAGVRCHRQAGEQRAGDGSRSDRRFGEVDAVHTAAREAGARESALTFSMTAALAYTKGYALSRGPECTWEAICFWTQSR